MKALTVCQPYASLIVNRLKLVENRTWPTNYRGRLYIHAGQSRDWLLGNEDLEAMRFGYMLGHAVLDDCFHIDQIKQGRYDERYPWLRDHEHTKGPWCWILALAEKIEPVKVRGMQGIWNWDGKPS